MLSLPALLTLSRKPSAILARDGAAVVGGFLNRDEASELKATVDELFSAFAECTGFAKPDPLNAQAWNRYSYVGNDPLTFTDPNGFSWLSNIFHDISVFFRAIFANPLVRAVVQIAIAAILAPTTFGIGTILAAAASAAIVTGLSGGKLIDIVKAAAIAGATALAFYEVGTLTNFHMVTLSQLNPGNIPNFAANIAGHAAVGCLSAVASGGSCEAGAISAAAGSAISPLVNEEFPNARTDLGQRLGGSAVSGLVGGLAAIAGGGKFVDGAVTAAFGYQFNAAGGRAVGSAIGGVAAAILTGPEDVPGIVIAAFEFGEAVSEVEDALVAAYHYTVGSSVSSILANGLYPGTYATPNGNLSPLQAQIDLALSPNGLRDAVISVDLEGLRSAGYEIPEVTQVYRDYNMPGVDTK
jgi:hypothetical protein